MNSFDSEQRPDTSEGRPAFSNKNNMSAHLPRDADKHGNSSSKLLAPERAPDQSDTSPINQLALPNIESNRGDQVIHSGFQCHGCGAKGLKGIRWKCVVCDDYDLCEGCEKRVGIHPESHNFLKIKSATSSRTAAEVDGKMAVVKNSSENNFVHLKSVDWKEIWITVPQGRTSVRCSHCNMKVNEGGRYFLCYGKIFCEYDFWNNSGLNCCRCVEFFDSLRYFRFYGDSKIPIHYGCFKCSHCQKVIPYGEQNFTKDGISYCAKDYHQLFSSKCAKCGDFCKATYFEVEDSVHFHVECFNCFKCKAQLTTYLKNGDHFVCPNCFRKSN